MTEETRTALRNFELVADERTKEGFRRRLKLYESRQPYREGTEKR
jgi:hypothetical protein